MIIESNWNCTPNKNTFWHWKKKEDKNSGNLSLLLISVTIPLCIKSVSSGYFPAICQLCFSCVRIIWHVLYIGVLFFFIFHLVFWAIFFWLVFPFLVASLIETSWLERQFFHEDVYSSRFGNFSGHGFCFDWRSFVLHLFTPQIWKVKFPEWFLPLTNCFCALDVNSHSQAKVFARLDFGYQWLTSLSKMTSAL